MKSWFISNYRGCSDYFVRGQVGRCSIRYLNSEAQSFYGVSDLRLLGTVVFGNNPAPEDVVQHFQEWLDGLVSLLPELEGRYVKKLTTAKWYQPSGWIRCEQLAQ